MIYSTPEFFVLFFLTLVFYFPLQDLKHKQLVLIVSSLIFYSWAGLRDGAIFFIVLIVAWLSAYFATRYPKWKKQSLMTGIVLMVLHLFIWKYANWLSSEIQLFDPNFLGGTKLELPLPIGISFFTLQGVAYLADMYRNKAELIGFREFVLFKSFFPQLVAGPIVRLKHVISQLRTLPFPAADMIKIGLLHFAFGFFKKVVIADNVGSLVDPYFADPSAFKSKALILGAVLYSIQIWSDFSGYTDMGRGAALILGVRLPENFKSPYLALSPSEFWKRWHITLSEWIRDYIYIPMGGNKGSFLRVSAVAILTMLISGLWHGANWVFVIWGLYHGLLLVLERVFVANHLKKAQGHFFAELPFVVFTYCAVVFGWILFRAENFTKFREYIYFLFSNAGAGGQSLPDVKYYIAFCFLYQIANYYDFSKEKYSFENMKNLFLYLRLGPIVLSDWIVNIFFVVMILVSLYLRNSEVAKAFIYFQF